MTTGDVNENDRWIGQLFLRSCFVERFDSKISRTIYICAGFKDLSQTRHRISSNLL